MNYYSIKILIYFLEVEDLHEEVENSNDNINMFLKSFFNIVILIKFLYFLSKIQK